VETRSARARAEEAGRHRADERNGTNRHRPLAVSGAAAAEKTDPARNELGPELGKIGWEKMSLPPGTLQGTVASRAASDKHPLCRVSTTLSFQTGDRRKGAVWRARRYCNVQ
jgi:hypothetical protein